MMNRFAWASKPWNLYLSTDYLLIVYLSTVYLLIVYLSTVYLLIVYERID